MGHKISTNKFSVDVIGGIGNQLFCYSAALYLANILGRIPVLNIGLLSKYPTVRLLELDSFILPVEIQKLNLKGIAGKKVLRTLALRVPAISILCKKFLSLYVSSQNGYDAELIKSKSIRHFHGYFQSAKYTENLQNRLEIKNPSEWFEITKNEIMNQESIVIHFRRGDLMNHKETVGILSPEFYRECLNLSLKSFREPKIYVFSDSPDLARRELQFLFEYNTTWINPPVESNSAESLILMSLGDSLICANSTFSWWAAKWSGKESKIYVPNIWFRNLTDPLNLYPDHWNLVKSQWVI